MISNVHCEQLFPIFQISGHCIPTLLLVFLLLLMRNRFLTVWGMPGEDLLVHIHVCMYTCRIVDAQSLYKIIPDIWTLRPWSTPGTPPIAGKKSPSPRRWSEESMPFTGLMKKIKRFKPSSVWWLQKIRSRYDWCWKKCEAGQHPQVRSGQGASLGSWRTGDESKRSVWGVWGELISRPVANMPFFSLRIFNMSWIKGTKLLINSWVSIQKPEYSKEQSFKLEIFAPRLTRRRTWPPRTRSSWPTWRRFLFFYLIFEYFFSHLFIF